MSSTENFDGLCGILHLYASSDKQVRCHYEFGHHGEHSWANKKVAFTIASSCARDPKEVAEEAFIESVLSSMKK